MTDPADQIHTVLGLDVACDSITLFDSATGRTLTLTNDSDTLKAALAAFGDHHLAVCEATGGHEDKLLAVLHALGIPAHRADAAKVKAYIRSFGKRAKTDAIDARWLARYGIDRDTALARWQPISSAQAQIAALVARRIDLVGIRTQETLLLATMPELGRLNRRQAANVAGCAPHPRDSGKLNAYRHTTGGRQQIRPALFIATMAAARGDTPLGHFYRNLVGAGKPKKLAIAAVMREIVTIANARLRDCTTGSIQLT